MPFPSPGDLPDPGVERRSPALQADSLPAELPGKPLTKLVAGNTCICIVTLIAFGVALAKGFFWDF